MPIVSGLGPLMLLSSTGTTLQKRESVPTCIIRPENAVTLFSNGVQLFCSRTVLLFGLQTVIFRQPSDVRLPRMYLQLERWIMSPFKKSVMGSMTGNP